MNDQNPNKTLSSRIMTQMNLRVTAKTADAFRAFCRDQHLTQNEGLAALLLSISNNNPSMAEHTMLEELQRYKTLNDDLSEKVRELTEFQRCVKLNDWKRCRDWATVAQSVFDHIVDLGPERSPSTMKVGRFPQEDSKEIFHQYEYLNGSGCAVVHLDGFMYGKGIHPALFILTHQMENGKEKLIKFRYYQNDRFFGVPLLSTEYAYPGSLWLMGYMPATDGASALISALPVECIRGTDKLFSTLQNKEKSKLDTMIEDAARRKTKR